MKLDKTFCVVGSLKIKRDALGVVELETEDTAVTTADTEKVAAASMLDAKIDNRSFSALSESSIGKGPL